MTVAPTPNWVDPAYDLAGNMTKRADPGDLTTDASAQLLIYDAWNRLVQITDNAASPPRIRGSVLIGRRCLRKPHRADSRSRSQNRPSILPVKQLSPSKG